MKLKSILIENFRCLEDVEFNIAKISGSYTYTLIGINETGKSSFLEAISLIDEGEALYPLDFLDEKKAINIYLNYDTDSQDLTKLKKALSEKGLDKKIVNEVEIEELCINVEFKPIENTTRNQNDYVIFKKSIFSKFTLQESNAVLKNPDLEQDDFDLEEYIKDNISDYFWKRSHKISFWKSSNKYLINEPIDLNAFLENPEDTSIPLFNCFGLAGLDDIKSEIEKIKTTPAEISNLQEKLSDKVTLNIKKVWPNHPIKIKFLINNMHLSFLIEDEGVKYQAKTTSQRSDGFKQFISFLLTVSAENTTQQLYNSVLLLDEPETHLHPQAQEYLRKELIKLSKNKNNNIVIFATHSNYMIDKNHLDRCFRVTKDQEAKTNLERIERNKSTYSEVNYEVFEVPTTDYHNELYGYLEVKGLELLNTLPKNRIWLNEKSGKTEKVSLAKYIRHSIHHPENTSNTKFTSRELLKSIKILKKLKYDQ